MTNPDQNGVIKLPFADLKDMKSFAGDMQQALVKEVSDGYRVVERGAYVALEVLEKWVCQGWMVLETMLSVGWKREEI